jgi:hypothetical protein
LGRLIAQLLVYAAVAIPGGYLLRLADPARPFGAGVLVLFTGMVVVGALVRLRRIGRRGTSAACLKTASDDEECDLRRRADEASDRRHLRLRGAV